MKPETAQKMVEWMDRVYDPEAHIQRQTESFAWGVGIVAGFLICRWVYRRVRN